MAQPAEERGVIYVMSNPSYPGLVKIGKTRRGAIVRARELSHASGVPTDFEVMYDELVCDVRAAEREIHGLLADSRINKRREFFRVAVRDAIHLVQEVAVRYRVLESDATGIDVLPAMETRMRRWLRRDLVAMTFLQFSDLCIVRWITQPDFRTEHAVERLFDLTVFGDWENELLPGHDGLVFSPRRNSPQQNVSELLNLDPYSMIMTGLDILSEEAADHVAYLVENLKAKPPFEPRWSVSSTSYEMWGPEEEWVKKLEKGGLPPTGIRENLT